jgi:hypothetical protein
MKKLLKPELVGLMDNNEEEFVMLWTIREWLLKLKELIHLQI